MGGKLVSGLMVLGFLCRFGVYSAPAATEADQQARTTSGFELPPGFVAVSKTTTTPLSAKKMTQVPAVKSAVKITTPSNTFFIDIPVQTPLADNQNLLKRHREGSRQSSPIDWMANVPQTTSSRFPSISAILKEVLLAKALVHPSARFFSQSVLRTPYQSLPMAVPLLFLVHGFHGTTKSFCQVTFLDPHSPFPDDLQNDLKRQQHVVDIFKYSYDSHGEYDTQVTALADTLKRVVVGRRVIIIGHLMGGLLAVDAAIGLRSEGSVVTVVGVLVFESPFFGFRKDLIVNNILAGLSVPIHFLSPIGITFPIVGALLGYFSNKQVKQYVDEWFFSQRDNVLDHNHDRIRSFLMNINMIALV
ncbi:hypothetical protein BDK51DRAFT_39202 [Blyttiomyces helicus]|uniref:AB hydrolase-1 domain-containing protein n=1 Tax=Blyttiomyces helicus TaxID=388810 RepID=A0A4P9W3Q9_9FUNG|nr:hypothetical protein BDK51DRAFT_39202 [Blyttiomyces helicus]|eukprot:RKO86472.1 hypothetical protein BDK51DRAFT_39202 [Blyttiomyces helicus]